MAELEYCEYCGQYWCCYPEEPTLYDQQFQDFLDSNDEPDDTCHCGNPECGAC